MPKQISCKFAVGDLVYRPKEESTYKERKLGIITKVHNEPFSNLVDVVWDDGNKQESVGTQQLRLLAARKED